MPVGFELCACTYSASSKLMPAVLSETVAVTASVVFSFLFISSWATSALRWSWLVWEGVHLQCTPCNRGGTSGGVPPKPTSHKHVHALPSKARVHPPSPPSQASTHTHTHMCSHTHTHTHTCVHTHTYTHARTHAPQKHQPHAWRVVCGALHAGAWDDHRLQLPVLGHLRARVGQELIVVLLQAGRHEGTSRRSRDGWVRCWAWDLGMGWPPLPLTQRPAMSAHLPCPPAQM